MNNNNATAPSSMAVSPNAGIEKIKRNRRISTTGILTINIKTIDVMK